MGSKGGGSGTTDYYGTIACVIGKGPLYGLKTIILNGETVWPNATLSVGKFAFAVSVGAGMLLRSESTNPVNLTTKYGVIRLYWGTEDQTADPTLSGYEEHPPYRGIAYAVFVDFNFGQATNAYNAEFICAAAPDQSIVTGASAAESLDNAKTCNAMVAVAEILTSPAWLGLAATQVDQASFQATADAMQALIADGSAPGRSMFAISPFYDSQDVTRGFLADIMSVCDGYLRIGADGKIQAGLWRRDGNPPSVTVLTHDDFSEVPETDMDDRDTISNSFAVEFRDSEALHKDAASFTDNIGAIIDANGVVRRTTLKRRPLLITYDQALRAGEDVKRRAIRGATVTIRVRFGKAVTPEGAFLQPGDYLVIPNSNPAAALVTQLIRVTKVTRPRNATAPVEIEGIFDPFSAPVYDLAAAPVAQEAGYAMPPIIYRRIVASPSLTVGGVPPIFAFAATPDDLAVGMDIRYDDAVDGDFPLVGKQNAFALPVSLVAGANAAAATVRVALLPDLANGTSARRGDTLLRNWSGGATEGRNDELLLVLLKRGDAGAVALQDGGQLAFMEILSIAGAPTLVATDTFDIPVLRGRQGTAALDFSVGSFPDAWSAYEGWVIPRRSLLALTHADFDTMLTTGSTGYFRLGAYARGSSYDPSTAYAEAQRRTAASIDLAEFSTQPDDSTWVPEDSLVIPNGLETIQVIGGGTYDDL